jgi:plasmid stability protein
MMEGTKAPFRLQTPLDAELLRRARIVAANHAVGLNDVVRTALEAYVKAEEANTEQKQQ